MPIIVEYKTTYLHNKQLYMRIILDIIVFIGDAVTHHEARSSNIPISDHHTVLEQATKYMYLMEAHWNIIGMLVLVLESKWLRIYQAICYEYHCHRTWSIYN